MIIILIYARAVHIAILFAGLTAVSTAVGGFVALRGGDRLHLILGLAAGLMLGFVGFDLIPTVYSLNHAQIGNVPDVALMMVGGFLLLHVIERASAPHEPQHSDYEDGHVHALDGGIATGAAMVGHVFLDGVGIGAAFRVSTTLGGALFVALLVHAFNDGLNTVAFLVRSSRWTSRSKRLLAVDFLSRVSGAAVGSYFIVSSTFISLYLALFAGFVSYIATSHILPEAHAKHPSRWTLVMTALGVLVMFGVVAGGA
jgi:ZIP family zinc transporter